MFRFLSAALLLLSFSACQQSTQEHDLGRHPLDKADMPGAGSCAADNGDNFCGGPSDGICWCDELCEQIGDCCDDKAATCDGDVGGGLCDDFVPPCIDDSDCGAGFSCVSDPNTCSPSACSCDAATGSIICTQDCGGSECVADLPPPVETCSEEIECGAGEFCDFSQGGCLPCEGVSCEDTCTGICEPLPPASNCLNDDGCNDGEVCDFSNGCAPCPPGMICPQVCMGECVAEPTTQCFSTSDCAAPEHCSVDDGECLSPVCPPGMACPQVCMGECVL